MKKMIGVALLVCGVLSQGIASAKDLNEIFDSAFGAMVNTTAPGAYAGSSRGILVGGGIEVRTKLATAPAVLGFTRPTIKAGCGGISIFGGSFSAINLDEFTEYLRSVMSNALGYLFKIGIESICPSCGKVLNDLDAFVGKVNSWLKDSCSMGKLLADKTGLPNQMSEFMENNAFNTAVGAWADDMESFIKAFPSGDTVSQQAQAIDPAQTSRVWEGNIVYQALKGSQSAKLFDGSVTASGVKAFAEYIQSVTGTLVFVNDGGQIKPFPVPHTLEITELLGGEGIPLSDKKAMIIRCTSPDINDTCPRTQNVEDPAFLPMADRVAFLMKGGVGMSARGLNDTIGIVNHVKDNTELGVQEKNLVNATRIPVMTMLVEARPYPTLVDDFGRQLSTPIAISILDETLGQILKEVERAIYQRQVETENPAVQEFRRNLIDVRARLAEQIKKENSKEEVFTSILQKYKIVRESLNGRSNLNAAPGTNSANAS